MWLALIFILGCIFVVIAGVLSGGIFTIVLVPLAVIVAASAIAYLVIARAAGARELLERSPGESTGEPMPRSDPDPHQSSGRSQTTPDRLVKARQQNQ